MATATATPGTRTRSCSRARSLLGYAAESCHKQISCRNKPEPGYICSDLRDSLLHMVITGDQEQDCSQED